MLLFWNSNNRIKREDIIQTIELLIQEFHCYISIFRRHEAGIEDISSYKSICINNL